MMVCVRVIARSTLYRFVKNRVDRKLQQMVKGHLDAWYAEVEKASWRNSVELKQQYRSASILSAERVAFNIKGNEFRLVVAINYQHQLLLIKWLGTHEEYDEINAGKVNMTNAGIPIHPIRSELDHERAVARIGQLMSAAPGTPEGDELDVLATLVDAYEAKHYPMDAPDPVTAIEFRMEQQGLKRKDLEPLIGSRARVSEVLTRKRNLTLDMVRRVKWGLGISADLLIGGMPNTEPGVRVARATRKAGTSKSAAVKAVKRAQRESL